MGIGINNTFSNDYDYEYQEYPTADLASENTRNMTSNDAINESSSSLFMRYVK
jgi:hypothetical protein